MIVLMTLHKPDNSIDNVQGDLDIENDSNMSSQSTGSPKGGPPKKL